MKVMYYKKSKVIISIEQIDPYQLIQGTLKEHMSENGNNIK